MDRVRIDRRWLPLNALRAFEAVALPLIGAVALWLPGRPVDVHPGTPVTVTLDGTHHATAYDPLNGAEMDPLFVDPEHHDYRLQPDSPALNLGFRPIDISDVGPRR